MRNKMHSNRLASMHFAAAHADWVQVVANVQSKVAPAARHHLVRFPTSLLEVSWEYTTPIGGEFFFSPSKHWKLSLSTVGRVLIGFLDVSACHMTNHNLISPTGLAASIQFLSYTSLQLLSYTSLPLLLAGDSIVFLNLWFQISSVPS